MSKLNLAAMSYDKDAVFNALQKTGATEIKLHSETEYSVPLHADCEELKSYLSRAESALDVLTAEVGNYFKEAKQKTDALDEVEVSYSEFMSAKEKRAEAEELISKVEGIVEKDRECNTELTKVRRQISSASIYAAVKQPLKVENTAHARYRLGVVPKANKEILLSALENASLSAYSVLAYGEDGVLLLVASHKSQTAETDGALQEAGFTDCPFTDGRTGEELYISLKNKEEELLTELNKNRAEWGNLAKCVRELKVYCDYVAFELEKAELNEKLRATEATFLLEAYVPKEAEELVSEALRGVSEAVYFEFSEPSADEQPPTLLKNNKVVKNFEVITNMYSPVNSREFDPNGIMSFFYSLFLGFIMGDIGYGILMILGGGIIYYLKRREDSGLKRMAAVFGIGGIFTIMWGVLFGSLFGIEIIHPFMPNAKDDTWSIMGINIPSVLIIAMELGIVHLMAGYICKAIQHMRRGHFWDGILDGFVWAVFSIGAGVAIAGFVEQANMPLLVYIGGGLAGGSLLIAMLTAGRKEKFFGKITKGFGAAYGIINYVSDILSYARLYGLMLSGAVIAQIIAEYTVVGNASTVGFLVSGNPLLIILGVFIFVVGHIFNLGIGLLGAYIHDARLQYVEFFGRFYEGEGELFAPLGSTHKYIKLQ